MQSKVASFAATPDPTFGQQSSSGRSGKDQAPKRDAPNEDPVDLRLIIEEDQASGTYLYKTVNRRTGEVIRQLPREEILKLRDEAEYVAGEVIRTKA
jgi:flagellar protein FlaG